MVNGLLTAMSSVVAEHGLGCGFSSFGSRVCNSFFFFLYSLFFFKKENESVPSSSFFLEDQNG